jgi:predicted N-acyltransferase
MSEWELLTLESFNEWAKLVDSCNQPDIHFSPEYMKTFEENIGGQAMLFIERDVHGKNFLLYPFFKRKINDLRLFASLKEEFHDIISPWYFGGPLLYSDDNDVEIMNNFLQDFQSFSQENNIITEFIRIHPILDISKKFVNLAGADYRYDVSYVNLNQSFDQIWNKFKKSNRNAINAAKRKGVEIQISKTSSSLKLFYDLYVKSMDRLKAEQSYFFSLLFLEKLLETLRDNMIIFTAFYNGVPISSSIFLFKYGIVHYWLSGSDPNYKNLYPNNLILHEAISWAKNNDNKTFVLMGGTSEGLRSFKESFTDTKVGFYTMSKIHNPKIYSQLVEVRKSDKNFVERSDFFPAYRI